MGNFLLVGTLAGLILSLFHAVYMFRLVSRVSTTETYSSRIAALNFSLWTCALWALTGGILLGFWLVSVAFYLVFKAFR